MPETPSSITRINEGQAAQERVWVASRIAWTAMAVVLLLAVAGLFGEGTLAGRGVTAPDGSFSLEYEGFQRRNATTELVLRASALEEDGAVRICLDRGFTADWRVVRTLPAPDEEVATADGVCLRFAVRAGPDPPPPITFEVQPRAMSYATRGTLRANGGTPVAVSAWVWP